MRQREHPGKISTEDRLILDSANSDLIDAINDCTSDSLGILNASECAAFIIRSIAVDPTLPEYIAEWIREGGGTLVV